MNMMNIINKILRIEEIKKEIIREIIDGKIKKPEIFMNNIIHKKKLKKERKKIKYLKGYF